MGAQTGVVLLSGGVPYRLVFSRLKILLSEHSGTTIQTQEVADESGLIRFRAEIFHPAGHLWAVGHAEERRGDGDVNRTAALQNAETSAVGRALNYLARLGVDTITHPVVLIDGKPYERVESRLVRFRLDHGDSGISTEIYHVEGAHIKARASILDTRGKVLSTGHAEIQRGTNPDGKDLEDVEISAVGRALALVGYVGDYALASAEEVYVAKRLRGENPQVALPEAKTATAAPTAVAESKTTDPAPAQPPDEVSGYTVALDRTGFKNVTGMHPQTSMRHPKRYRCRRTPKGFYVEAHGPTDTLKPLGFAWDANQHYWWLLVPAQAA